MRPGEEFFNLYSHDFVRVAVATPFVHVGDPAANARETTRLMQAAAGRGALVVLFPELGLSAYSCEDLFHQHQRALLDACRGALGVVLEASRDCPCVAAEIRRWLDVFLVRFFETSQFKRSAVPNAPKVGSGGALSPRADWRAPSDGRAIAWRAQLALIPDHE